MAEAKIDSRAANSPARKASAALSAADFPALVARHRHYFVSGATRSVKWRKRQLIALRSMMKEHAEEFYAALWTDLRRSRIEADWADVKYMSSEIDYALVHLSRWMKPLPARTPLVMVPSRAEVRFEPLGVGLIIGTWNYPVMLALSPLVSAIAAGNCAVINPSEISVATAELIARRVPEYLDREAFSVVLGGAQETTALLDLEWDHIFFTGSATVAKIVMAAAAKRLTPVVLELGGKSPAIVHSSANLRVAARRIAYGRWFNAGQTCTAPDYVLVFKSVAQKFLQHLKEALREFYGDDPRKSPDYARIVNTQHFDRVMRLLESGTVCHGGEHDRADRFIAPTVLVNVPPDSPAMQEEIFGPVLPVIEVGNAREAIEFVNVRPSPLGLYVFGEKRAAIREILRATRSGSAVINDCMLQPIIHELPFGGVGNSGMGKYHGEWGFRGYSNARGVLQHSTRLDFGALRYPPYARNRKLRDMVIPS